MDPLSLTASIIAVVQLSHAVLVGCYRIRGKVQGAEGEISQIIHEVEDLTETLAELHELFEAACENKQLIPVDNLPPALADGAPAEPGGDSPRKVSALESALATSNRILSEISKQLAPFSRLGLRAKLTWPFESKSVESKLRLLEKEKGTIQLALAVFQSRLAVKTQGQVTEIQGTLAEVHTAVVHEGRRVAGAVDKLRDQARRLAVLNWFKTSDPEQNHKASRDKHEPETAQWIFKNESFEAWQSRSGRGEMLWLHGIPGAGKTILSSTVIEHLQAREQPACKVIYYYFDFGDAKKQTATGLLQSAIYQLISRDEDGAEHAAAVSEPAAALFDKHNGGLSQPTAAELMDVFLSELSRQPGVFLVIDALDECLSDQRQIFFDLFPVSTVSSSGLRVFIASRKEPDIEEALSGAATYTISLQSSDVDADVRVHVGNVIAQDKGLSSWKPAIKHEILEAIVAGAHGMFRWAVCQLDIIKKCLTPAMVRAELKRMPPTLQQTYDRILQAVDDMHRPFVRSALRWLAFAARPLTLEELAEAVVIDPDSEEFDAELCRLNDDRKILELCGALVTLSRVKYQRGTDDWVAEKVELEQHYGAVQVGDWDKEFTVVSLSHYSVKEYISCEGGGGDGSLAGYHVSAPLANNLLGASCLLYLLEYNGGERARRFDYAEYALLAYAARHWTEHWKAAAERADEGSVLRRLYRRLLDARKSGAYVNWLNLWNPDPSEFGGSKFASSMRNIKRTADETEQPLYRAAELGDLSMCRELVAEGNDPGVVEGYYESAMGAAAYFGHLDIVDFFLEQGADPNLKGRRFGSVLHAAAAGGSVAVVERLIAAGADVNAKGGEYNSALIAAASKEHDGVVALLLRNGADINIGSRKHGLGLYQAAATGDLKMAIMLLGAGADVNEIGDSDGTPIYGAALAGSVPLIQTLLRRGADVNKGSPFGQYGYPLVAAAVSGHINAVRTLIRAGAELNPPVMGTRGVSPLEAAIESRDLAVFKAVFSAGGNPNTRGTLYMNAFHGALWTGEIEMARILLLDPATEVEERGFIEAVSRYDEHPWFLEEILRTREVDINAAFNDKNNSSVMHVAIREGGEKSARLLLERGPYLDVVSDNGSLLSVAIERGMVDLAKELISLGVDIGAVVEDTDAFGLATAKACEHGSTDLLDLLLEKGADVSTGPYKAVSWAAHSWKAEERIPKTVPILKYLLGKGASLDYIPNCADCTPLQLAASEDKIDLVRILLDLGADVNGPTGKNGTSLFHAICSRNREIVDLFLERGVKVDDTPKGKSLLVMAMHAKMPDLVPTLLDKGADVNQTRNAETPLEKALDIGDKDLVQLLSQHGASLRDVKGGILVRWIKKKSVEDVRELLEYGADPNRNGRYDFVLEAVVERGMPEMLELLLEFGLDINKRVRGSRGPLAAATAAGDMDMIRLLLSHGADPGFGEKGYYSALDLAARGGKMEILDLLLTSGADIRIRNGSVFDSAIWGGERIISRLLEEPMTPAERQNHLGRLLHYAARATKHAMCAWLLDEHGANVNWRGPPYGTPLQAALSDEYLYSAESINNRINLVEMLIKRGADVNLEPIARPPAQEKRKGGGRGAGADSDSDDDLEEDDEFQEAARCRPLLLAVRLSLRLTEMLLDAGADVSAVSPAAELYSPLQCAARYGPARVRVLLDRGAEVGPVGGKYGTALHAASYAHDADTLRLLLERGADVNVCAGRYGSAMQAAAKLNGTSSGSWTAGRKSVATLEVLLAAGADVNAAGGKYGSALQMAAKSGNMEAVRWLIANGADVEAKGGRFGGVREAALAKKQWSVLSYLWRLYGKK